MRSITTQWLVTGEYTASQTLSFYFDPFVYYVWITPPLPFRMLKIPPFLKTKEIIMKSSEQEYSIFLYLRILSS